MLLDEKFYADDYRSKDFVKHVLSSKYSADRYKISDEVVTEIAWLLLERPHLLLNNFQFALPPKPEEHPVYVEWDIYKAVNLWKPKEEAEWILEQDRYLGIIVKNNFIGALVSGKDSTKPVLHYVSYGVGDHKVPANMVEIRFKSSEHEHKLAFLLGGTYNDVTKLSNNIIDWLLYNVYIYMEEPFLARINENELYERLIDCNGEFRFMMSMLLWINQQHITYYDRVPASRGFRERGRPIAFAAHNVVKLQKNKNIRKAIIQSLIRRAGPRRHEVRSTWRTINAKPGCEHTFPVFPDDRGHFVCQKCEAKRFRVKKYYRGDATKGCVVKEYVA